MKISLPFLFLILLAALPLTVAAAEPEVIYWNSDAGKALRAAEKARQLAEQTGTHIRCAPSHQSSCKD